MGFSGRKTKIGFPRPLGILIVGLAIFGGLIYSSSKVKTKVTINGKNYECRGIPSKINATCISCLDWNTNESLIICSETTINSNNSTAFPIEGADIQ